MYDSEENTLWILHKNMMDYKSYIFKYFENINNDINYEILLKRYYDLKKLIITYNWINILSSEIGELINLEKLLCYSNQLFTLPVEIANFYG